MWAMHPSERLRTERPVERVEFEGLSAGELIARIRVGVDWFDPRVGELSNEQLDRAFLPEAGVGRMPCRVLIGHLADAELLMVHRMRRVASEEGLVIQPWDQNATIDAGFYGDASGGVRHPIGAFVAVIHTLRQWAGVWLGTLSAGEWERRALHPEYGELTVRRIAEQDAYHLEHHAWYLNRKVRRLLGETLGAAGA